jgi:hypothetical protein
MIFIGGCIQKIPELDVPFQLKIDQVAFIKSENIKIIFKNVTEDSRCPSDVECIWEGQVTIVINIFMDNQFIGQFNLTSSGFNGFVIKEFDGYSISLLKVDPYPISTEIIELNDYIVTFNVSKM